MVMLKLIRLNQKKKLFRSASFRRKKPPIINVKNPLSTRNITRNITVTEETTLRELLEMIGAVGRAEKTPTARTLREKKHEDGTVEQIRRAETPEDYFRTLVW